MEIKEFKAPSYKELRPLRPPNDVTTDTFPVYKDLVEKLVAAKFDPEHRDELVAHVMGVCAGYGYSDGQTVAMIMARLGLEDNNCRMIAEDVDVMFITSTSFLIQSKDGRVVILCYRGTPPASLITWVTDLDVDPVKLNIPSFNGSPEDYVHGGYYRNVRSTGYEIVGALARAIDGRSVLEDGAQMPNPLEALYITGHSLGGASAAMLAIMLLTEPLYKPIVSKLKAVYTFGAADDHQSAARAEVQRQRLPPREGDPLRIRERHRSAAAPHRVGCLQAFRNGVPVQTPGRWRGMEPQQTAAEAADERARARD